MPSSTKQHGLFGFSTLSLVASGLVIVVILTGFLGQSLVLRKAQRDKATLTLQLQSMQADRDRAVAVAQANATVIAQLQQEKVDLETAVREIQAAQVQAEAGRSAREVVISQQAGAASSKAITAPVISSVIQSIEADRKRRPR